MAKLYVSSGISWSLVVTDNLPTFLYLLKLNISHFKDILSSDIFFGISKALLSFLPR